MAARPRRLGVRCYTTGPSRAEPPPPPPAPAAARKPRPRIPRDLAEVDNGRILGFGPDLAPDHPGFGDAAYAARRRAVCAAAAAHRLGDPAPRVDYTPAEAAVWAAALRRLEALFPAHACAEYLRAFPLLGFTPGAVPQLADMQAVLDAHTGWRIRPVAGLLRPRDFLAGLAFRTFHSTQFLRHPSRPHYTPEPDLIHEALGHVPMLADADFCDLVRAIGVASLGADDAAVRHLTRAYWYTVEFGVVLEGGAPKAFGAGILSSFGEMEHFASGAAELVPFDPFAPLPPMSYRDGYQARYFAVPSFAEGAAALRAYCAALQDALPDDALEAVRDAVGDAGLLRP